MYMYTYIYTDIIMPQEKTQVHDVIMYSQRNAYTALPLGAPLKELTWEGQLMQWDMPGVGICVGYMLLVTQGHR